MPARKPREIKSAAPSPSPGPSRASARSRSKLSEETVPEVSVEVDEADENGVEASTEDDEAAGQEGEAESAEAEAEASGASSSGKLSMVERMQKLKDLRMRMVSLLFGPGHLPPVHMLMAERVVRRQS